MLVFLLPGTRAQEQRPLHRVSAEQLQRTLDRRFPLRLSLGGLATVTMRAPILRMLPELDRVGAALAIEASGPGLERASGGEFDVDFRLRYEPRDRTLRAYRLRVNAMRVAGLPPPYPELLQPFSALLAEQSFGEIVLHRLGADELALPDAMGLEPDTITVTPQGLLVGFAPKPPRTNPQ